jgi:hypothetical protein
MTSYLDADSYRCISSLQSELRIVRTLQKLAKRCLSPKLKAYAPELQERRVKLIAELKIRAEEENLPVDFGESETIFGIARQFKGPKLRPIF